MAERDALSPQRGWLQGFAWSALFLLLAGAPGRAETLRVGGRVRVPAGVRMEGIRVELSPLFGDFETARKRLAGAPGPAPLASVRPRADGTFELAAPASGCYRVEIRAEGCRALAAVLRPLVEEIELAPAELRCAGPVRVRAAGGAVVQTVADDDDLDDWMAASFAAGELEPFWLPVETRLTALPPQRPGAGAAFLAVRNARGEAVAGALVRWDLAPLGATGADGRLAIALPHPRVRPPTYSVEAPGGEGAEVSLPAGLTAGAVVPVVLHPPEVVSGRVVDAAGGQPVPGALVWQGDLPTAPPARADADGRFALPVPRGASLHLSAAAAGFLLLRGEPAPRPAGPPSATLRLKPAAALSGVVVDRRGAPVAGARLAVSPSNQGVWSRPDGRFLVARLLPRGTYELTVRREGYGKTVASARTGDPRQPASPLRIVLGDGQRLLGRVLDPTGNPVAGAELTLTWGDEYGLGAEPGRKAATADAAGAFLFPHLSPGRFELRAARPGYAPARRTGIVVGAGDAAAVDLGVVTLEPGVAIEGTVTDGAGNPIAGAQVDLGPPDRRPPSSRFDPATEPSLATGPDGRFRFADLERGAHYDLWVHHPDYAPVQAAAVTAPTAEPLRLELKAARSVSGRVLGPDREPVPGAELTRIVEVLAGDFGHSSGFSLGASDARGAFRLAGLAPGTLTLEVSARGYRTRRMGGIPIPEERDVENLELTLERGVILSGRVLDGQGEPVGGAHLTVQPEGPRGPAMGFRPPGSTQTDGEGRWQVDGLEPGPVAVQAWSARGKAAARAVLVPGENALDLHLAAGVAVVGRVSDESGEALPNIILKLTSTASRTDFLNAVSEADGSFAFPNVPDGRFTLRSITPGYAEPTDPGEIEVAGRPVGGIELRLTRLRTAAITGRLSGIEPGELPGVQVAARSEQRHLQGAVHPDGRYRIDGATAGEWRVEASSASGATAAGAVRVEPGAPEAVLDLEFQGGGLTLAGRLLVDGRPLAGAEISVGPAVGDRSPAALRGGRARTAYDGTFSVPHLAAGTHELLAVDDGGGFGYGQPVEVAPDRAVEIRVTTGGVRGRVLANGGPVAGADVVLAGQDPVLGAYSGPTTTSDDQGGFELRGVGPGTYRVTVRKGGFAPAVATLAVRAGETAAAEIELSPGAIR